MNDEFSRYATHRFPPTSTVKTSSAASQICEMTWEVARLNISGEKSGRYDLSKTPLNFRVDRSQHRDYLFQAARILRT